jgi:hypothetical protein
MQFYDAILYNYICEIRFEPRFIYHGKRYEICEKIQNKLPNWNIDIGKIELNDSFGKKEEDRKNFFRFTNRGASLNTHNAGVYENFKSLAEFIFPKIIEGLGLVKLDRIGIRSFFIYQSDSGFSDLKDFLFNKLYNVEVKNNKIFGEITDIAYVINTRKNNCDLHIEIGPLKKEEIMNRFGFVGKIAPEVSILLDLDCSKKNVKSNIILNMLKEYNEIINDIQVDLLNYLKKEK